MNQLPTSSTVTGTSLGRAIERSFTRFATSTSFLAGQPAAFVLAVAFIALWIVTGPFFNWSDTWQLVVNTATTIVTFLMVFVIQNAQNRDAAALQAKLDEVIRSTRDARNEFIGIEHLSDTQIEEIRAQLEIEAADRGTGHRSSQAMERLLSRR
jgi:low affinity Fe/Cu permease